MIALKLDLPDFAVPLYSHALRVFEFHSGTSIHISDDAEVTIGEEGSSAVIQVSRAWLENLRSQSLGHSAILSDSSLISLSTGEPDYLSTCCYLMNYFQEYGADLDKLGRFSYHNSLQKRFGVVEQNLVWDYLSKFAEQIGLSPLADSSSRVFVSHDNDSLFGSFTKDGLYALKKGRVDWLFRIVWSEIMKNPRWMNMDRMMDINDEYSLKSTFFWIADNRPTTIGGRKLENGDYKINSEKVNSLIKRIESRGFYQGLHKSLNGDDFAKEIEMLPYKSKSNRNHFLRLNMPNHLESLDASQIQIDFSMGFAEEFGLRNNFAQPLRPLNLNTGKPSKTLLVPLMIMDTSNWTYRKESPEQLRRSLAQLLETYRHNSVISVLWHNKYFTDMKFEGYLEAYRTILDFCRANDILPINQEELLLKYPTE